MKIILQSAILIERYKRFLADITLTPLLPEKNQLTTIHVANTGAMTGCADKGNIIFYSRSNNPKRKYPFSWEISQSAAQHFICVNTLRANQLVEEALTSGIVRELNGFTSLKREVKYGDEGSRIDFLLTADGVNGVLKSTNKRSTVYIEVKSVTLLDNQLNGEGQGYFPDSVSTRGQKHLRELITIVQGGDRAILFFAVLHSGINKVSVAEHIDKKYAALLTQAQAAGVEILVYKVNFNFEGLMLDMRLTKRIAFN